MTMSKYRFLLWFLILSGMIFARTEVAVGQTREPTAVPDQAPAGTLKINLLLDGRPVAPRDFNHHAAVTVFAAGTASRVRPLSGGYGYPSVLPSGTYDVVVRLRALGAGERKFSDIRIDGGNTIVRQVDIPRTGTLKITARWTDQPLNIVACARYYNPFNPARWGALMGGHSVSRGKCLSPAVYLTAWISSPGRSDGNIARISAARSGSASNSDPIVDFSNITLVAGIYDISLWPIGRRELAQTLAGVTIAPGELLHKELEFRWPEAKK